MKQIQLGMIVLLTAVSLAAAQDESSARTPVAVERNATGIFTGFGNPATSYGDGEEAVPEGVTLYVDGQDPDCDDSSQAGSPQIPFCTIQVAYGFAPDGAQIRVMPGTYNQCLFLFDRSTRKSVEVVADAWLTNSDNTVTIIDATGLPPSACEFPPSGGPASVVNIGGTGSSFAGFTVTGGQASGVFGIGSVAITHSVVENNASSIGGGLYIYSGNCYYGDTTTTISNNTIRNNTASGQGGGVSIAAGLYFLATDPLCSIDGDATIEFSGNTVSDNASDSSGGGIYATVYANDRRQATVAITSNAIHDNTASTPDPPAGSGIIGYGAGVYGLTYGYGTERIELRNNQISRNSTFDFGGGVDLILFPPESFPSNDHRHHVEGNSITDNEAGRGGGGIEMFVSVREMDDPQVFSMIFENNTVSGNDSGRFNDMVAIDDPLVSFGGGGVLATFESLNSTSSDMEFRIENNTIDGNTARVLGGGVGFYLAAEAVPRFGDPISPADAGIEFVNNLVTSNRTESDALNSIGGGAFAYLTAVGPATATLEAVLNTITSNTLDNTIETGGIHVESFTAIDAQSGTDGRAEVVLDSSIILDNEGVGLGGPVPGQPGIKTPGGTGEFTVVATYNDLFGNALMDFDTWVVPGPGNIFEDPLLDPITFLPHRCSPTIDTANPALDFSLEPQPNGGRANMGHTGGTTLAQISDFTRCDTIEVVIDIKPGSFPNSINPYSRGVIPVAILGSDALDVATIDPSTLAFGPNAAAIAHREPHTEDVNVDGLLDLVLHSETRETGVVCGDESATLTGELLDGTTFEGTDSIQTVGCRAGRRSIFARPGEARLIQSRGGESSTPQRK